MSLLYHYTNINGLLGILRPQSRDIKLWFTDVRYQNDISEGKELTRIYKKVCKTMKARGEISEEDYKEIVSIKFNNKRPIAYTPHDVTRLYHGETDVYMLLLPKPRLSKYVAVLHEGQYGMCVRFYGGEVREKYEA